MALQVDAEQQITAVRFCGDACIISCAAASILTELIQHWTLQQAEKLAHETFIATLNTTLRPSRMKCALLPLQVLQAGITAYRSQSNQ